MKTLRRLTIVLASSGALLLTIGLQTYTAEAACGRFPASGQTTAFTADKNDGIPGAVAVPDDGTVEAGITLKYKDNGDGTITDRVTRLKWEKKCSACGGLHDVANTYRWSGNGAQETIWDFLDDINAEGGTGFAEHNDWRIPNAKELQSIVDYERQDPRINPIFGPTVAAPTGTYWSSTTDAADASKTFTVDFSFGDVFHDFRTDARHVRAVRGGCL